MKKESIAYMNTLLNVGLTKCPMSTGVENGFKKKKISLSILCFRDHVGNVVNITQVAFTILRPITWLCISLH